MRVKEGARKINTQGGAIFIHYDKPLHDKPVPFRGGTKPVQSPFASIEIRDFVYTRLIEVSSASRYRNLLITGEKGLLSRGLKENHIGNYGGLPAEWRERDHLARMLFEEANDQFPLADSALGLPGFWKDNRGIHLWKQKDHLWPRLLIPVRDECGRIQACQMRLPFAWDKSLRYLWLSSSVLPQGTGSGSPLHFKFRLTELPSDAWIVVVEGVLKADVLSALRPELHIVATPCVTANHNALIELTHGQSILLAFDQDFHSNETVCFHLAALIAKRMRRERTLATTRIALWDARFKGIDDAALHDLPITSISVRGWFNRLSPHFQQIAMTRFSEIGAFPLSRKGTQ